MGKADHLEGLTKTFLIAGLVLLAVIFLVFGSGVLVPLAIALLIWFLINAMAKGFQRLSLGALQMPRALALVLSLATIFVAGFFVVNLVVVNVSEMSTRTIDFGRSLNPMIDKIAEIAGISNKDVLNQIFDRIEIENLLRRILATMTSFASQFVIIMVYVIFLMIEQRFLSAKLGALVKDDERRERIRAVLDRIAHDIQSYLWIVTLISALTASLSYAAMVWRGLDHAAFWAFLIFVLNFIPTIGSILSTAMPAMFALLQFQNLSDPLLLLIIIGAIQFVIGNLLQPRLAGQTLNMSQFIVILSLFVWGAIWGVAGMFLAVPMTAILMIVLSNFETTRPVAILMSQKGQLETAGGANWKSEKQD